jgi:hypothetical protein
MHATQGLEVAWITALLATILIMAFWRTLIKVVIALAATAIIATIGYGAIMIWQSVHHIAG